MKKTLLTLCLTFAATLLLQGAPVYETKNFEKIQKNGMPDGWRFNAGAKAIKQVKYQIKKNEKTGKKTFIVDLKALPKYTMPIMFSGVKCKAGDKLIITAKAKVSGTLSFTLYRYGKGLMKSIKPKSFRIMNRMTTIKAEFIMTDDPKDKLSKVTTTVYVPAGKVTEIEDIKIELLPAAAKK